jgi:hypothetical protein
MVDPSTLLAGVNKVFYRYEVDFCPKKFGFYRSLSYICQGNLLQARYSSYPAL